MEEKSGLMMPLAEKIESGRELMKKLNIYKDVPGVGKLSRKINQEIRFLEKVRSTDSVKREHLHSTNLIHLTALVERLLSSKNPAEVLKPFKFPDSETRLTIDIICDGGATWIKVIARNARALTLISLGNGGYGQKSILDHAKSHLKCATLHPHHYKPPNIIFYFAYGIETTLYSQLEKLGVFIEGDLIEREDICPGGGTRENPEAGASSAPKSENARTKNLIVASSPSPQFEISPLLQPAVSSTVTVSLNLDVSTLLAYNGRGVDRSNPFYINSSMETARAQDLLQRVNVVEDATDGRILNLIIGGKIKLRSRLVFASGENTRSVTVSANEGFVRAARMQGVECTAILHEPRSLSELKEKDAKRIDC
ncbi:UPF0415 protein C7orf25 homolog isoform X2 [Fopius arisanus]|uniref:UPF0415 protein C7orf25 homolog isoform X2 n=1 Tax=Fopius arisanus TaxID=64838 RepID=A0A9R1TGP2_9HYME|nr:PREDICTED: UPF0415 protein C7orf25 homolog isoform X2 [Fopius arisanus]